VSTLQSSTTETFRLFRYFRLFRDLSSCLHFNLFAKLRPMRSRRNWLAMTTPILLTLGSIALLLWLWRRPPEPLVSVVTLAIAGRAQSPIKTHHDPFGIAADSEGNLFVSETITGKIYRIPSVVYSSNSAPHGETIVAGQLETPSAIAFDEDGNLVVANTGAHTIMRVDLKTSRSSIIAGTDSVSGSADGSSYEAQFNGPVGVGCGEAGSIYVADTYNDRIRVISRDGQVRTLAGGSEPGFADGTGSNARFDTPCGIAIAEDGSLLVADTGNHRIRRVELNGRVTTVAGTGEAEERDGVPLEAAFDEPTAITVRDRDSFYVADAGGSTIRLCTLGERPAVETLAGGYWIGLADGELPQSRLNRPTGLALLPRGELALVDSGNGLVRALVPGNTKIGRRADPKSMIIQAGEMRALIQQGWPRWPFDPPQARRDIAGTYGEIRGERLPDHESWFHNGLDIPGADGEPVRALFTERVTRPLAVIDDGGPRERLRLPLFEYIHLRVGRDQNDHPVGNYPKGAITLLRDQQGDVNRVRIRRGTLIEAGNAIGTLNRLHHVHLVAGPAPFEFNALSVLNLPGLIDTVPPVIETVKIRDEEGRLVFETARAPKDSKGIQVNGRLRIMVRAYDQVDTNPRHRRLGLYRLGYQIISTDGRPAPEFEEPRYNVVFDRLPVNSQGVLLAFAEGSQSGYEGATVFDYIVTNVVKDGEAREDFWITTELAPGDYTLRVVAEDYFGNQARRDLPVTLGR
jgi:DNA-binding beta-propeller fold protein YncE